MLFAWIALSFFALLDLVGLFYYFIKIVKGTADDIRRYRSEKNND